MTVRRMSLAIVLFSLAIGTAACKQGGQLSMQSDAPGPGDTQLSFVEGAEFVSAGGTYTSSTNHYTMQSSLGDYLSDIEQTSPLHSTLYSTVEGQMISTQ